MVFETEPRFLTNRPVDTLKIFYYWQPYSLKGGVIERSWPHICCGQGQRLVRGFEAGQTIWPCNRTTLQATSRQDQYVGGWVWTEALLGALELCDAGPEVAILGD